MAAPREQITQARVQADTREKEEQQQIAGIKIERYRQAEEFISEQSDQRCQNAASNRIGNVPAAERTDTPIDPGANKEYDDRDRESEETGRLDSRHGSNGSKQPHAQ